MDTQEVVRRIGHFRVKQNLSARELSLRINRHESYIAKLESKDFNLPLNVFLDIVIALGVPIEEFFAGNFASFGQDREILDSFMRLSYDCKVALLTVIKHMR